MIYKYTMYMLHKYTRTYKCNNTESLKTVIPSPIFGWQRNLECKLFVISGSCIYKLAWTILFALFTLFTLFTTKLYMCKDGFSTIAEIKIKF